MCKYQTYLHVKLSLYVFKTPPENKNNRDFHSKVDFLNLDKRQSQEIQSSASFEESISPDEIHDTERYEINDAKNDFLSNELYVGPKLLVSIAVSEKIILSLKNSLTVDLILNDYSHREKARLGSVTLALNDPISQNKILIIPIKVLGQRKKIKGALSSLIMNPSMLRCKKKNISDKLTFSFVHDSTVFELSPSSIIEAKFSMDSLITSTSASVNKTQKIKHHHSDIISDEDSFIKSLTLEGYSRSVRQKIACAESLCNQFETVSVNTFISALTEDTSIPSSTFDNYKLQRKKHNGFYLL